MSPSVTVVVPTRRRAPYLDVALASIAPQVAAEGAEVVVVDDGPDLETRAVAERHGARYVELEPPGGLNAARNAGFDAARADLLAYVDDDVEVGPGWLHALREADAACPPDVGAFAGPIHVRIEDHRFPMCGREGPPLTFLDLGPADRDVDHAWGANMAIRRAWVERVGRFDETIAEGGDEAEWQDRVKAAGGRVRYVAAAALDHRRAGDDARLRSLMRGAHVRGRAARRFDALRGQAPSVLSELRVLAGCLLHGPRYRCANGPVLSAHAAGRLREALGRAPRTPRADTPDFLSGTSGTVGGKRDVLRVLQDAALDLEAWPRRQRLIRAAVTQPPRRRVLVLGIERPGRLMDATRFKLLRSRHDVTVRTLPMGELGKFQHLNRLLAEIDATQFDWLFVVDDDVELPKRFTDRFLCAAEGADLRLAQPAHRRRSHAAWPVTRRRPGQAVRRTRFVEIGPVTALHRDTFGALLPFPDLRMGWGLDLHWGALAAQHGWRAGIVDATPVRHVAPVASAYSIDEPIAEARRFLDDRPYVTRDEANWSEPVPVRS